MFRRTSFLIDPKMQLKVISLLALVAVAGALAICGTVFSYHQKIAMVLQSGVVTPDALAGEFRQMTNALMTRLGIITFFMITAFTVLGFMITHRIAGPLYKLRVELQRLAKGEDVAPIKFRKDDELQDLPELINQLIEKKRT